MPIDSSVVSGIRPLQLPDLAKQFSDSQGIAQQRQLHNQQLQMNDERLKSEQRANKEADIAAQGQEKGRQAYISAKGDPDQTVQKMIEMGVDMKTVEATKQHFADYAKKVADIKAAELPGQKYKDEQMLGLHDQAIQLATNDPQGFAAAYPQLYATAVKLDPAAAKQLDPNTPPTVDQLRMSALGYNTHLNFLGQEEEKRKVAEEKRKQELQPLNVAQKTGEIAQQAAALPGVVANSTEAGLKAGFTQQQQDASMLAAAAGKGPAALASALGQLDPSRAKPFLGMSAQSKPEDFLKLGQTPDQQLSTENNVSDIKLRLRAAGGDEKAKKALADEEASKIRVAKVEAQNKWDLQMGALTQAANGEPGAGVKLVADYQMPLNQLLSRTPPAARALILDQITKLNPTFQESQYDVAKKTENDSVTGKIGTTANAQNTALAHLGVLHDAAAALKNGNVQLMNKVANAIGAQTGNSAKTTYDAIVHKVGPELTNAYVTGGGSVGERGSNEKDFSSSMAPQQIIDNIAISAKLLEGKIKANQSQYERGTFGRGKQKLLTDEASATLKKLSSGGAAPTVTTKAEYDALPSGTQYMEDGKKYRKP